MNSSIKAPVAISQIVPMAAKWISFITALIMCSVVGTSFYFSHQPYVWTGNIIVIGFMIYVYLTTLNVSNIYLTPDGYLITNAIREKVIIGFHEPHVISTNMFYCNLNFNNGKAFHFYPPIREAFIRYFKGDDAYKSAFSNDLAKYVNGLKNS